MSERNGSSTSLVETVAGLTAGVASTLTLHPLDLIKTRLQIDRVSRTRVGSSLRLISDIYRAEGGLPALYRGLTPNIIGNSTSWGLYFLLYGNIKDSLARKRGGGLQGEKQHELGASKYFLASGAAGLLTSILTNPIWVIKTRMLSTGSRTPGAYTSFISGASQILRTEGIPGFYRGLVPALFGVSHGAFQFMAYEKLKTYRSQSRMAGSDGADGTNTTTAATSTRHDNNTLNNMELLLISGLSKTFAGCITYPYQVLRTRLQLQAYRADAAAKTTVTYRGVLDATGQIWAQEGVSGFYKGLGPSLLRVLPSTWVVFLVYENTKTVLSRSGDAK